MAIDPTNLAGTATLTFNEDFNTLSLQRDGVGIWNTNYSWGGQNGVSLTNNGEKEWYIDANYAPTQSITPWTVSDGILDITARNAPADIKPLINGYDYTSGMLTTESSFSQQYGYFEMRAEMPSGAGLWPAFWLLNAKGGWPPELDIMEQLGKDPNNYYTTVHSQASGAHTMDGSTISVPDVTAGFHNYGVDWQADNITFYFDGKPVYETATPADMHDPMYMIVNLAVGGYWPGDPVADPNYSETLKVDYIRVYSDSPDAAPAAPVDAGSQTPTPPVAPVVDQAPPAAAAETPPSDSAAAAPAAPVTADAAIPDQTGSSGSSTPDAPSPAPEQSASASPGDAQPAPATAIEQAAAETTPAPTDQPAAATNGGAVNDVFQFDHLPANSDSHHHAHRGSTASQVSDFMDSIDMQSLLQTADAVDPSSRHGCGNSHPLHDIAQDFHFDHSVDHFARHGNHHHAHDWTV